MQYVKEIIKNSYHDWKPGDTIFISSPTGSGKTTFILDTLLKEYAKAGKKILYLVNRKILKEQIKKEILSKDPDLFDYIKVELYQKLEEEISSLVKTGKLDHPNTFGDKIVTVLASKGYSLEKYLGYDCIVCDEAHYFLMDSNYNTNTILSYNFVKYNYSTKIRIFLSATIDDIRDYIIKDNIKAQRWCTAWLSMGPKPRHDATNVKKELLAAKNNLYNLLRLWNYDCDANYDYLDINVFRNRKELVDMICTGTDKWLIFVDSKNYGSLLKRELHDLDPTQSVKFITSDYKFDVEATGEVFNIRNTSKQEAKVLIATSVLDNGINLSDAELRNIVLITDTKTEFLQMLGRKRSDGLPLSIYINPFDKKHFERRLRIAQRKLDYVQKKYEQFSDNIQRPLSNVKSNLTEVHHEEYNRLEFNITGQQQVIILQEMMSNKLISEDVNSSFLFYNGLLYINPLSRRNLQNLCVYYQSMIEEFNSYGQNVFLEKQLAWLGIDKSSRINKIKKALEDKEVASKNRIIELFDKVIEDNGSIYFDKKNLRDVLTREKDTHRSDFYNAIASLSEHKDYDKYYHLIEQKKKPVSRFFIEFLAQEAGIPFKYELPRNEEKAVFRRLEESEATNTPGK